MGLDVYAPSCKPTNKTHCKRKGEGVCMKTGDFTAWLIVVGIFITGLILVLKRDKT